MEENDFVQILIEMGAKAMLLILLNVVGVLLLLGSLGVVVYAYLIFQELDSVNGGPLFIAMLTLAGLTLITLIASILGIVGALTSSKSCMLTFAIFTGLMVFVYLAGTVTIFKVVPLVTGDSCTSASVFQLLQKTADNSLSSICYNCPCYMSSQIKAQTYSSLQINSFSIYAPQLTTNANAAVKSQQCSSWNSTNNQKATTVLQSLESNLQCSGWCQNTSSLFFRFTNVNNGIPTSSCYQKFYQYITTGADLIKGFFIILVAIGIVNLMISYLLYFDGTTPSPELSRIELEHACSYGIGNQQFPPPLSDHTAHSFVIKLN